MALLFTAVSLPYGNFTDEHEQLTGGWFVTQGLLPYRDFFSHHGPVPLYLSAVWLSLPHFINSLLWLRVGFLVMVSVLWLIVWKLCRPHHRLLIGFFLAVTALASPLYNLHMALSSTLIFHLLLSQTALLFNWQRHHRPSLHALLWFFGITSILAIWTSPATLLPELGLWGTVMVVAIKRGQFTKMLQLKLALRLLLLFAIVPLFFFLQNSFAEFKWSLFTYNTKYYYPLRLAQNEAEKNYGLLYRLGAQFSTNTWQASTQAVTATITLGRSIAGSRQLLTDFSLNNVVHYFSIIFTEWWHVIAQPRILLYALFVLTTLLFLIRKPLFGLWYLCMGVLFTFRDNELFQLNAFFGWTVLGLGLQLIQHSSEKRKRVFLSAVAIFLLLLVLSSEYGNFIKHRQPLFSSTLIARKSVIEKYSTEHIQVLDGNLADYWLTKRFPANKYYFYHPWLHHTPIIREEMVQTLTVSQPEIVIASEELFNYAPELKEILDKNYSTSREDKFVLLRRKKVNE